MTIYQSNPIFSSTKLPQRLTVICSAAACRSLRKERCATPPIRFRTDPDEESVQLPNLVGRRRSAIISIINAVMCKYNVLQLQSHDVSESAKNYSHLSVRRSKKAQSRSYVRGLSGIVNAMVYVCGSEMDAFLLADKLLTSRLEAATRPPNAREFNTQVGGLGWQTALKRVCCGRRVVGIYVYRV